MLLAAAAAVACCAAPAVRTGADLLSAEGFAALKNQSVGVVANPTSILPDLRHIVDAMHESGLNLTAVFGPEHGFRGAAQDGHGGSLGPTPDPRTGFTVYGLYGRNVSAISRLFRETGVKVLVFDMQDIGTRFYTYVWTLHDAIAAAAEGGVETLLVLDRPNPLGDTVRGPILLPEYSSGIGNAPVTLQHGMTVGELALMFRRQLAATQKVVAVNVLEMIGWRRTMTWAETGLPWVPPSPNMPTLDTAAVYPGMGLLEGFNMSVGRGTTRPFETVGAPGLDWRFGAEMRARAARGETPGASFRAVYFEPTFNLFSGAVCSGVELYRGVPAADFDSVTAALHVIAAARQLSPGTAVFTEGGRWFDLHMGTNAARVALMAGDSVASVVAAWSGDEAAFRTARQPYLLYQ
eukprot:TRINITY_DN43232_c0_g1_i1.p1 TRINITY_DN43232_c0_g1~~TRINITY_DN43232_c0_g1_i1.p1  ORF type:complete len:428 (+),score=125.93 TRINITY_DN43232_c0_g1_i1:65-1285(+)